MELFDTHTHLDSTKFDGARSKVIERAHQAGVTRMITCGTDGDTNDACIALAQATDGLYAAVGIHGHQALSAIQGDPAREGHWSVDDASMARVKELSEAPEVVAIGEIGLDYHYDFSPRPLQRAVFARCLSLARVVDLPVILHNRESDADMSRIYESEGQGLRGVMHCFLADMDMARWALDHGLYIGVDGPITFKNVHHLPEIVRFVPLDRLLLETDCPYLAPHPKRGKRNEPAFLPFVCDKVAEVKGIDPLEVARQTTANACQLFGVGSWPST